MIADIVYYLTDGFWEWHAGTTRKPFRAVSGDTLTANITALTPEGQQFARWALDAWSTVTGINFTFVDDDAHITFDDEEESASTHSRWTYPSDGATSKVSINVSAEWVEQRADGPDSVVLDAYLHEIGHALGLGHPGPYNTADDNLEFFTHTVSIYDSSQFTVMTYFDQEENPYNPSDKAIPITPMLADILAVHELYGTPESVNGGNSRRGQDNFGGV